MRFAFVLVFSSLVFAQAVEVGVEGGVPITHAFSAYTLDPNGGFGRCGECATQRTLPYVVGTAVQIHLWRMLYLDAQGLYSRVDYTHTSSATGAYFTTFSEYKKAIDRWEFPILLKAQLNSWRVVHPYVAAGVSLEHSHEMFQPVADSSVFATFGPNSAIGSTVALGTSFGSRRVRPSIEVRYTRWSGRPLTTNELTVESKQDEVQFVAGLMFGAGRSVRDSAGLLEGAPGTRRVSLGIKGGALLSNALSGSNPGATGAPFGTCFECGTARNLRYVGGPAVEVRIVGPLSVTAEGFYSRADYDHTSVVSDLSAGYVLFEEKHAVDRWEAPLMLKYAFKVHRFTPFVAAGASIGYDRDRRVRSFGARYCFTCTGINSFQAGVVNPVLDTQSSLEAGFLDAGATVGAGTSLEVGGRIRPSIEIRFTRWADRAIAVPPAAQAIPPPYATTPTITSSRNEVQLLVGFMF